MPTLYQGLDGHYFVYGTVRLHGEQEFCTWQLNDAGVSWLHHRCRIKILDSGSVDGTFIPVDALVNLIRRGLATTNESGFSATSRYRRAERTESFPLMHLWSEADKERYQAKKQRREEIAARLSSRRCRFCPCTFYNDDTFLDHMRTYHLVGKKR